MSDQEMKYDVIIIGAGPAGYTAGIYGLNVVLGSKILQAEILSIIFSLRLLNIHFLISTSTGKVSVRKFFKFEICIS